MFTTLNRIIRAGWLNFWRNSWLSLTTISVTVLVLIVIAGLLLFNVLTNSLIQNLENKIDVSVYFKNDTTESQILKVKEELAELDEVKTVEYTSKEKALAAFKAKHAQNPVLMQSIEELGFNPLSSSLSVKTKNPSQYEKVSRVLEQDKYKEIIEKINYQQNKGLIERLARINRVIARGGWLVSLVLAVIAILVAFNTISLTIYNFREEIAVMRLVGASNFYIRGPFLTEGILYGVFSTIIALIFLYPILYFVSPRIISFLPDFDIFYFFQINFWQIFLLLLGIGIALGVISSSIAIRRYLKV